MKTIEISKKSYEVEFTRRAAMEMEDLGFSVPEYEAAFDGGKYAKLLYYTQILLWGGLKKHRPDLTADACEPLVDALFAEEQKEESLAAILEEYCAVFPQSGVASSPHKPKALKTAAR